MASGTRSEAWPRGAGRIDLVQRARVRRHADTSVDVLRGRAHPEAGDGGRGVRSPRGAGLPHGEWVVFREEHRVVGRALENNSGLGKEGQAAPYPSWLRAWGRPRAFPRANP